ncbi:hypothetical protein DFQ27_000137 [Actinomortierella ambigua]|uniref:GST C-terminal domain-containing protein n=1 Tax=Actinomortierella ambigua TaxID=1343610 RepID=A0A9P6PMH1_9FUNG|nr:hypothetical protein DFQ27_000137 [Actinomortierella ambigua]
MSSAENDAIMKDPSVSYTLAYFDLTSVGAISRDLLGYSGKQWKCEIHPDIILSESMIVDQYLAGIAGLLGDNDWEGQVIRALYSSTIFLREIFYEQVCHQPTHAAKVQSLLTTFLPVTFAKWLNAVEFHLQENARRHPESGYFMGNKISLADVAVANFFDYMSLHPAMFSEPILAAVRERPVLVRVWDLIAQEPRLAAWRASADYKRLVKSTDPASEYMARLL